MGSDKTGSYVVGWFVADVINTMFISLLRVNKSSTNLQQPPFKTVANHLKTDYGILF